MNKYLEQKGRDYLKELLAECTDGQQTMFKRMYSHTNLYLPINDAVDNMSVDKIDRAIQQCELTVLKNEKI